MKSVLGKGLGALIPSSPMEADPVSVSPTEQTRDDGASTEIIAHIEVAKIQPNPYQPRTDFDPQAIRELAQSIVENGLIQPITVRRHEGKFQLISGERRVRACQEAGITQIPAYIRRVETIEEMIELSLIENIQRETLNPIEIALAYQRLVDDCRYTHDQIAVKVGKNRTTVINFIRLLKLPGLIRESIVRNELSMGHARALVNVATEADQMRIWHKTVRESLSVRQVEKMAQIVNEPRRKTVPIKKATPAAAPQVEELISKLRAKFATKVNISITQEGKGNVSIDFYSHDDFDRVLDLLLKD